MARVGKSRETLLWIWNALGLDSGQGGEARF